MFEHFGIMDVFSAIRKYIKSIIAILIVCACLFCLFTIRSLKNIGVGNYKTNNKIYNSSVSYYFEPIIKPELTDSDIYTLDMYRNLPDQYAGMLNNDFCRKYVKERIMETFTAKEISDKSSLVLDESKSDIEISGFNDIISVEKQKDAPLLKITAETYSKELTNKIVSEYSRYLNEELGPKTDWVKIKLIGEYQGESLAPIISETNQAGVSKLVIKIAIKSIIIPLIAIAAIELIVVFFIALFIPTINRKSDFLQYDIKVISEIGKYRSERKGN